LWHGASYNFVLWGGLHGLALVAHKAFRTRFPERPGHAPWSWGGLLGAWLLTQLFVFVAWVPFRATTFGDTGVFLHALTFLRADTGLKSQPLPWALLLIPILVEHVLVQNPRLPACPWPRRPWLVLAILGLALALVLPLIELKVQSFIYFQF
jgi:alginate O-acetyltransferase complex protein AlgI